MRDHRRANQPGKGLEQLAEWLGAYSHKQEQDGLGSLTALVLNITDC